MSAASHVKMALRNVEQALGNVDKALPIEASGPFSWTDYRLELDATPELGAKKTRCCQGLIGVLRWCIELRQVDVMHKTMLLSSYLMNPREGHLDQAFHIFTHLKKYLNLSLVFDDTLYPTWTASNSSNAIGRNSILEQRNRCHQMCHSLMVTESQLQDTWTQVMLVVMLLEGLTLASFFLSMEHQLFGF